MIHTKVKFGKVGKVGNVESDNGSPDLVDFLFLLCSFRSLGGLAKKKVQKTPKGMPEN